MLTAYGSSLASITWTIIDPSMWINHGFTIYVELCRTETGAMNGCHC